MARTFILLAVLLSSIALGAPISPSKYLFESVSLDNTYIHLDALAARDEPVGL
jgi:hypothetical protein